METVLTSDGSICVPVLVLTGLQKYPLLSSLVMMAIPIPLTTNKTVPGLRRVNLRLVGNPCSLVAGIQASLPSPACQGVGGAVLLESTDH